MQKPGGHKLLSCAWLSISIHLRRLATQACPSPLAGPAHVLSAFAPLPLTLHVPFPSWSLPLAFSALLAPFFGACPKARSAWQVPLGSPRLCVSSAGNTLAGICAGTPLSSRLSCNSQLKIYMQFSWTSHEQGCRHGGQHACVTRQCVFPVPFRLKRASSQHIPLTAMHPPFIASARRRKSCMHVPRHLRFGCRARISSKREGGGSLTCKAELRFLGCGTSRCALGPRPSGTPR